MSVNIFFGNSVQFRRSQALLHKSKLNFKIMEQRVNVFVKGKGAMKAMFGLGMYLETSSLEQPLLNLIYYRVSQINGCAFCLDMHSKDLMAEGETAQRLLVMDAWRETPFYTEREQAALAWAEALTELNGPVPDDVYQGAATHFSEEELVDLTLAVIAINGYNRVNRSEEHTSELQSLMRISYAVFCLKKKTYTQQTT